MPSTEIKLAWAVEVKVDELGASLEAYDRLQPIISTLRLCNRFGHGEDTAVRKLPVELVQQIEDSMMQEEKIKTSHEWAHDFKCWQSKCEPIDHHTDAEILANYNVVHADIFQDGFTSSEGLCECCGAPGGVPLTEVTEEVRKWAAEDLEQMSYEGFRDWVKTHEQRLEDWGKRVGQPTASSRGLFNKFAKVLDRDFGLKVWISHVQQPGLPEYTGKNVMQSTKACLHLPATSSRKEEWDPLIAHCEYDPQRKPTESGSAYAVNIPKRPSKASLARFDRALKSLGLNNGSIAKATPRSEATMSAEDDQPNDHPADQPLATFFLPRSEPELTMLVRNCDESEW